MTGKGIFISFEGIDGCGKTTQLELVEKYLVENNKRVVTTLEPGALSFGQKIREILLNSDESICYTSELFLFLSDRAQHVNSFIRPKLNDNFIVLCDRFIDSTVAYQGFGRGHDVEQIEKLNNIATNYLLPDLTIVFDVDVEKAYKRRQKGQDRIEACGIEFQKKVRNGYLKIASENPQRVKIIDSNKSIEDVFNKVKGCVDKILL